MEGKDEKQFPAIERRSGLDRRARVKVPRLFSSGGRRKAWGRRKDDEGGYVDQYDFRTWAVAFSVLILSCLDAVLTWLLIYAGRGAELNPLMKRLIQSGSPYIFLFLKLTITSIAMAVIVAHRGFKIGRLAARFCLWSYIVIGTYHIYLVLLAPKLSH
jgi:hypothetical protein